MEPKINFVTLLILIILGVAVGNLVSSFITTKYFQKEHVKETAETSKVIPTSPSKTTKSVKPETFRETVKLSPEQQSVTSKAPEVSEDPVNSEQLIEQRKLDEIGIRLAKTCNEWTVVHKDMNTQTSERGMNKHCAEYYDYLSFGKQLTYIFNHPVSKYQKLHLSAA